MKAVAKAIKKGKEVWIAPRKKEYLGLCSSCKTASHCTFTRDSTSLVLQCEEFEGYEPRIVKTTVKNILLTTDPQFRSSQGEADLGKYRGLCSICEDREVCNFLKPEGGVWHCEEYR